MDFRTFPGEFWAGRCLAYPWFGAALGRSVPALDGRTGWTKGSYCVGGSPGLLVSILFVVGGIGIWSGLGQMVANMVASGATKAEVTGGIIFVVGPTLLLPVWGVALAVATLGYYYRRRGLCKVCGRGASTKLVNLYQPRCIIFLGWNSDKNSVCYARIGCPRQGDWPSFSRLRCGQSRYAKARHLGRNYG